MTGKDHSEEIAGGDWNSLFFRTLVPIRGEASRFQNKKNPTDEKKLKKIWREEKNDYLCNPQTGATSGA